MSPIDFLHRLDLTNVERQSIAGLGVQDAATLAHMIRASRHAFEQMIGDRERAARIEAQLRTLLTAAESALVDAPASPPFSLGARLDPAPKLRDDS